MWYIFHVHVQFIYRMLECTLLKLTAAKMAIMAMARATSEPWLCSSLNLIACTVIGTTCIIMCHWLPIGTFTMANLNAEVHSDMSVVTARYTQLRTGEAVEMWRQVGINYDIVLLTEWSNNSQSHAGTQAHRHTHRHTHTHTYTMEAALWCASMYMQLHKGVWGTLYSCCTSK